MFWRYHFTFSLAPKLYKLLGVSQNATTDEISSAFRSLALRNHPDHHQHLSSEDLAVQRAKFREILHAYQVLRNSKKRSAYDLTGEHAQ